MRPLRSATDALTRLVALIDDPAFDESIRPEYVLEALRESGEMEDARRTLTQGEIPCRS